MDGTNINLFEVAARKKFRFGSPVGLLAVEDLFDLPLQSDRGAPNLDAIAKVVYGNLKATGEQSFVSDGFNPAATELEQKLELLKLIIATKKSEAQAKLARQGKLKERARLLEILEKKQEDKMMGMSAEEIQARIAELGVVGR